MGRKIFNGRLFGHPVHPMLVHFPTALFTAGLLFDVVGSLFHEHSFFSASFYVILLGVAMGLLAALFGLLDYVKLGNRPKAFNKATWHAGIQFLVLIIFGTIAGVKSQYYPAMQAPNFWQLFTMGIGVGLMIVGNYLGGELVFTYKVGFDEDQDR